MGQVFRAAPREAPGRRRLRAAAVRLCTAGERALRQGKNGIAAAAKKLRPWAGQLGLAVLCIAAAAVVLPGQIAPFGLALCIAVPQPIAFVCCAGCALGGFLGLPAALAVGQAAGALLIGALRLVLGRQNAVWAGLAGVAVCSMLSQTAAVLGQPQAGPLRWLVQGLLVLGLALLYRELRLADWLDLQPRRQLVRLAVWTSLFCGLVSLPAPGGIPLFFYAALGLAGLVLVAAEHPQRLPLLWAAGALTCLCMRQNPGCLLVSMVSVWLAGRFCGRRGTMAAVYAAAGGLNLFVAESISAFFCMAALYGGTALLFCLLPTGWLLAVDEKLLTAESPAAQTPARTLQALACGLEAIGNGMEAVGRASAPVREDPNSPVESVCRQVCSACTQKARCWGADYDRTQQAMQCFLEKWRQECSGEFPDWFSCARQGTLRTALLRAENLRVLRRANQAENGVLRRAVSEQYRAVAEGLMRMAAAWQPETPQPQLESRIHALANALQLPVRELQALRRGDGSPEIRLLLRPVRLSREVLDTLTYSVSRSCGQPMTVEQSAAEDGQELRFQPRPQFALQIGVAAKARSGVCGDVIEQLHSGPLHYVLLCDGMGTGTNAAMDARMTALFTARLLRAGFACDTAARLVNAALLTRAPGDRGSTLDALCFNGLDGSAVLYKAGACAGYLVRGGRVKRLGGDTDAAANGLPLGSAGEVKDTRLELSLQPEDRVILLSDGMLAGGEPCFLQAIHALQSAEPQEMAQALLAAAGSRPEDDCTVVLLQVKNASERPPEKSREGYR